MPNVAVRQGNASPHQGSPTVSNTTVTPVRKSTDSTQVRSQVQCPSVRLQDSPVPLVPVVMELMQPPISTPVRGDYYKLFL